MIWTRTPLRVTLGGGGTDLQSYYEKNGGFIFALALDKYIYTGAHRPLFDSAVTLYGLQPEVACHARELKHDLVRAALLDRGIVDRLETASLSDVPPGTGLGSSSSFLVGFLRALHALNGHVPSPQALAEEACRLEIEVLARGIGKQDQYMAAFGGLTRLDITREGEVTVTSVELAPETEAHLISQTRIYYTGLRRNAAAVLHQQDSAMKAGGDAQAQAQDALSSIKDLGLRILAAWTRGDVEGWGALMHEHWMSKKRLSNRISWPHIDQLYDHVRANFGVLGGKVLGAGGGGFLMLCAPGDGAELDAYMAAQDMPRMPYGVDRHGCTVMDAG